MALLTFSSSLRKSKKILRSFLKEYRKKQTHLDPHAKEKIQNHLTSLQAAILNKEEALAKRITQQLQESALQLMPKTGFEKAIQQLLSIVFALFIAIVIRQMWFELYTIPSGSMRPTLKERDFLVVSKTSYGLNVPLTTSHFYFDPTLVQRGEVVVFTGENMDIPDSDTTYFYLFPGKKQFVKRLIGKPGDSLYFYGGQIYGVSKEGKDLKQLREAPWAQTLEHIPFIRFDGEAHPSSFDRGSYRTADIYQMNQLVAHLQATPLGTIQGSLVSSQGKDPLEEYSDIWGFKDFAMSRLLTLPQAKLLHPIEAKGLEEAPLYLELTHHPSIKKAKWVQDGMNRLRPSLDYSVSLLPLTSEQIAEIGKHLTTARFHVSSQKAYRFGFETEDPLYSPLFPTLKAPDGTYEFQNGIVSKVFFAGFTKPLSSDHPIYPKTAEEIQFFYNLGIEFLTHYQPQQPGAPLPSRYAYFRNHDLYLLGHPIIKKEDPSLILFLKREYEKQSISTSYHPYLPFDDSGAPLTKSGQIDVDFIRKYGITIPEKSYLMLGDNHAMSADSRQFGFVPQDNLKGSVSFLFSPPGSRWGKVLQPSHPLISFPNLFVLSLATLILVAVSIANKKRLKKPLPWQ